MDDASLQEAEATTESGWCYQFPNTTLLRLTGADRQKWLHNFCTADIKGMEPGQGCEAFILNVKGKTIAHAIVLMSKFDLTVLVIGTPEIKVVDHFNKYIITEDVQVEDIGENYRLWFVHGDKLDLMFNKSLLDADPYAHALVRDRSVAVTTRISGQRDWLLLVTVTEDLTQWYGGVSRMEDEAFERLRIQGRWPISGKDLTLDRLPQEFCRDQQAISFEKGCYLGQETVARIDAIGHVNYFFVAMNSGSDFPPAQSELLREGKAVGNVTSAIGNVGLGFVRRIHAKPGESFDSDHGSVKIIQ